MTSREPELYKDKIEVSLDGRQIFYLFFGGAVIVGVVFVLGVLVGRRVEARGHIDQARTQTATDPLAALDRLEGSGGLSFQGALTGKDGGHGGAVEKKIDQIEKARAVEPEKKSAKKKDDEPKAEAKPEPKAEPKAKPEPAADKPVTKPEHDDKEAKNEKTEKSEKTDKPEESKARFTLQLSSFQDKSEAQAFLETVKSAGFQATLTQAEVDGKGTFYRVRMGTYRSLEAANDAKSEFEKTAKKSASVMRL